MNFDNKGSFDIQSNASNIASNFNPMNMGRLNLEQNLHDDNLDEYIEKLSMEDSRFQTEEDFQKFLDSGMSFPESYSFMDNFWGSKASRIEEVDFDFNYPFVELNSYHNHPQPFQEGVTQYKEGNLNEATLAFEAALARDPESSDIWRWLGTTHAENDEDRMAIMAFQKSLKCDPSNIEALLDAGVSYTNELVREDALNHLQEWLKLQPEYETIPHIIEDQFAHDDNITKQKMVIEMFLLAAERNPADADLHLVLGVLWNITKEYDRAEEAFKEALKYDPSNPSLWNKLGATQANSYRANGSKDAVKAYRNAIDTKPNYVRAWANMGISYANQGKYDLAAKYYLKALSLNSKPDHLWSYLRLALNCLGRRDLAELVNSKNVDNFRNEFTF